MRAELMRAINQRRPSEPEARSGNPPVKSRRVLAGKRQTDAVEQPVKLLDHHGRHYHAFRPDARGREQALQYGYRSRTRAFCSRKAGLSPRGSAVHLCCARMQRRCVPLPTFN